MVDSNVVQPRDHMSMLGHKGWIFNKSSGAKRPTCPCFDIRVGYSIRALEPTDHMSLLGQKDWIFNKSSGAL